MLKLKTVKKMCAMGLLVMLYCCNLSYANANVRENRIAAPHKNRVNNLNNDRTVKPITDPTVKTTMPSNRKKLALERVLSRTSKGCACACSSSTGKSAAAPGRWWECMKGCLRSWGVSPIQLFLCAASCAAGIVPMCAICLALDATVFMLCANGCAVYASNIEIPEEGHEPILVRKLPRKNGKKLDRRVPALAAAR